MVFFRFKSSPIDLLGERIANGFKAELIEDKVKVSKKEIIGKTVLMEVDKDKFFERIKKHPHIRSKMLRHINGRVKI